MLEDCTPTVTSTPTPRPSSQMAPLSESPGTATPCAKTWHPRRASAGRVAGVPTRGRGARAARRREGMSVQREILLATRETGEQARFLLEVFNEHWTSTLARLDARGEPEPTRVAPRFYGLTAEQARSRLEPAGKIPCARSLLCEGLCAVEPAKVLAPRPRPTCASTFAGSKIGRAHV